MCTCTTLNRRRLLGLLPGFAAVAALAGCGPQKSGPVAVNWGKENCAFCGNTINDAHFAAEVREGTGNTLWKFDDLGCAAKFMAQQPWGEDIRVEFWAASVEHGSWLDGRLAWYVPGAKTPQNYGFVAYPRKRDGAVKFAEFRKAVTGAESAPAQPEAG